MYWDSFDCEPQCEEFFEEDLLDEVELEELFDEEDELEELFDDFENEDEY